MRRLCLVVAALAAVIGLTGFHVAGPLLFVPSTTPTAFFISSSGNDSTGAGTRGSPWQSFGKCQTVMQGSPTKTCVVLGSYSMAASVSLTTADNGETWTSDPNVAFPTVGAPLSGEPVLTETAARAFFIIGTNAANITIEGFNATGFAVANGGSCGATGTDASFVAATSTGVTNLQVLHNTLSTWTCAIEMNQNPSAPIISWNFISRPGYAGVLCDGCDGGSGGVTWQGNVVYDINPNTTFVNGYGIALSTFGTSTTNTNIIIKNNQVYNSTNWEGLDYHTGSGVQFLNNIVVGYDGDNDAINMRSAVAGFPNDNGVATGNVIDLGSHTTTLDALVNCGSGGCSKRTDAVGGTVGGAGALANIVRRGTTAGCAIVVGPTVTLGSNTCNLAPETVSTITLLGGGTSTTFTANQPNAVVATLAINMSATSWAFPFPPGSITIGGTNSGGFVPCNYNQICQPAGGTAAGSYNDFTVVATLDGMKGSPFTMTAGGITLATGTTPGVLQVNSSNCLQTSSGHCLEVHP